MAIFPVRMFGDPILKEKTRKIDRIDAEIKELSRNMAETMREASGVGLAAPQIGVLKRLIVIDMSDKNFVVYVNPTIKERSKAEEVDDEGCLCLPGILVPVKRAQKVVVEARDLQGRRLTIEADDLLARILQHEIDHLEGHIILDKTDPQSRRKAVREFLTGHREEG
jgi:peptide deformylase